MKLSDSHIPVRTGHLMHLQLVHTGGYHLPISCLQTSNNIVYSPYHNYFLFFSFD